MGFLDWSIIVFYFIFLLYFGYWVGRKNSNEEGYYVANRNLSWWAVGISTMATHKKGVQVIMIIELTLILVKKHNKYLERNSFPCGKTISQESRYTPTLTFIKFTI
ncbi:MAG: hypothetical protein U9O64_01505 [Campylobacterota bacterium]|nr:hypothetical protein [Campylobacterota bacterium]